MRPIKTSVARATRARADAKLIVATTEMEFSSGEKKLRRAIKKGISRQIFTRVDNRWKQA